MIKKFYLLRLVPKRASHKTNQPIPDLCRSQPEQKPYQPITNFTGSIFYVQSLSHLYSCIIMSVCFHILNGQTASDSQINKNPANRRGSVHNQ